MKLFNYDDKHQNVNGELNLGALTPDEEKLLGKVIAFLGEQGLTSRYHGLVLAESFDRKVDEEGESSIEFFGGV